MKPASAIFSSVSKGTRSSPSRSVALGATSRSANVIARSLVSCCSRLMLKFMGPPCPEACRVDYRERNRERDVRYPTAAVVQYEGEREERFRLIRRIPILATV